MDKMKTHIMTKFKIYRIIWMVLPNTETNHYPGLGSSDLYKPSARATIKGKGECAKKCFNDPNCVAFHHWRKHPESETQDYCYYWSKNNSDTEYGDLSEALGAGDEGKGSGYETDAYIKKQPDDDTNGGWGDGGPASPP